MLDLVSATRSGEIPHPPPIATNEQTFAAKGLRAGLATLRQLAFASAVLIACAGPAIGQAPNQREEDVLGTVNFNVSCQAEVSDDFDRAIAWLHHMQYEQSRSAFEQILQSDPDCGMAH